MSVLVAKGHHVHLIRGVNGCRESILFATLDHILRIRTCATGRDSIKPKVK
jgi:hypothetical protein